MNQTQIKRVWILIVSILSIATYAQKTQKTTSVNVSFGGRNHSNCWQPGNFCGMQTGTNKANANTQISYNKATNELVLTFTKNKTDANELNKLKTNKLEKGFYLYPITENFTLPQSVLNQLNIKGKTKIKKGNYLVKDKGKTFEMIVQLE